MKTKLRTALTVLALLAVLVVGAAPVQATPPASGQSVHVVQWGENLYSIALRYGVTVNAIVQANGLANANFIYAGQRLIIPTTAAPPTAGSTYVVRVGDTLTSIAGRFGITVQSLMTANRLANPNFIYVGQVLQVPGTTPPAPPTYTYYTVRSGDTLAAIAYRYGVTVTSIVQVNNLASSWYIYPGQVLAIPAGAPPAQQPAASYHTVRAGESLTRIALMYGTSVWALVQANNLRNPSLIFPGQTLVIPGRVTAPPPAPTPAPTPAPPAWPYPTPVPPPPPPPPPPPAPTPPGPSGPYTSRILSSDCTDDDTWEHRSVIRVSVLGLKDLSVKVSTNGFETTGLTGTKPEYGEWAVEFAPFNQGFYTITPEGLGTSIRVRLDGRCTVFVEFYPAW